MKALIPKLAGVIMDPLLQAALRVRENAHAPFSKFKVGAAVEDEQRQDSHWLQYRKCNLRA